MTSTDSQTQIELCPICGKAFPGKTGICPVDGATLIKQMADPLIGTLLPRHYRITGQIGRGAMSVVYKGIYEPLGQPVAIKLLKSHLVSDLQTFKRFQQEAKTAGALEHAHIVAIFDFGVTEQGVPYLVMELLEGESLAQRLRRERCLSAEAAIRVFTQVADALDYTHSQGIIHRDVKPSNIQIGKDELGQDFVKIMDYGIAKLQNYEGNPALNLTQTGEVFGTPLYVSPEQATGKPLDERADIYSLGCVMYEAIAGKPAFMGPTAFDVIRMQINARPQPIEAARGEQLPPSLVAAVDTCMAKDPAARYQSMSALVSDLKQAAAEVKGEVSVSDDRRVSARQPALVEQLTTSPKVPAIAAPFAGGRRSPIAAFAISSFAGFLCGLVILFFMHPHAEAPTAESQQAPNTVSTNKSATPPPEDADIDSAAILGDAIDKVRSQAFDAFDKGNYSESERLLKSALDMASKDKNKTGQALLMTDVCMINIEQEKNADAAKYGSKALKLLDGRAEVPQNVLSFALRASGTACFHEHQLARSENLLKRSVQIDKAIYGESDERYAIGVARLAKVLETEQKYKQAEKLYREAVEVSRRGHQPGDEHLAKHMTALAEFLRERHRDGDAAVVENEIAHIDKG